MYSLRDTGNTRRKSNQKVTIEKGGNPKNMANGIPQRQVRVITSMKNNWRKVKMEVFSKTKMLQMWHTWELCK